MINFRAIYAAYLLLRGAKASVLEALVITLVYWWAEARRGEAWEPAGRGPRELSTDPDKRI